MRPPFESEFRVSSSYGTRTDPFTGAETFHGGIDLVSADRSVRAAVAGRVLKSRMVTDHSDRTWEWGNYVSVYGVDGRIYYYCHLDYRLVADGDTVNAGDEIGMEGSTGRVTGMHLHFEVRKDGITVNPAELLGIPNRAGFVYIPDPAYIRQAHDWGRDAVEWAVQKGILKGRGGDDYALGEPITREELCVMLYRSREVL